MQSSLRQLRYRNTKNVLVLCCSVTLLRAKNILTLNILYLYIQLNNVQQCCVNIAAQSTTQYVTKTKSKMGDNSDKVVHVLQQLCSENIPVGTDGH